MEPPSTQTPAPHAQTGHLPVIAEHIGIRPGYCGGEAHILGHRIKVRHVAVWHEQGGMSPAAIVAAHPTLTLGEVHAAPAYYYDHRAEIQAASAAEDQFVEELTARAGPSPLQQKLGQRNATDDSVPPG